MFYLKIIILLCLMLIIASSPMCPVRLYSDGVNCLNCSRNCAKCSGSNPSNCIKCIPKTCKNNSTGECLPCISQTLTHDKNPVIHINTNTKEENQITTTPENNYSIPLSLIIIFIPTSVLIIIITILLNLIIIRYCRGLFEVQPRNNSRNRKKAENENPVKAYNKTFPQKKKLFERNLLLKEKLEIGQGSFGKVYKCPYVEDGDYILVAIKQAQRGNNEVTRELNALSQLSHMNIIQLLSVNVKEDIILIMPLRIDNLKSFLKNTTNKITAEHQIRYCLQIADAFRYIAHKKLVHADLKAANILVVNINQVEVADFGKCTALNATKQRVTGTLTHTALEILDSTGFSSEKSDVWSFGITAWEIFTRCEKNPYDEEIRVAKNKITAATEIEMVDYLKSGQRLNLPSEVKANLRTLLLNCWLSEAFKRPSFHEIFENFVYALPECDGVVLQARKTTADSSGFL